MPTYAPSGNTTTADLANVLPTILSPAREYIEKKTFVTEMVTKIPLKDGDGSTINMPKFGQVLQAIALNENVRSGSFPAPSSSPWARSAPRSSSPTAR
jgi:hypothetical protein